MKDRIVTACCVSCRSHAAASDRRSLEKIGWCLIAAEADGNYVALCPRCLGTGSFLVVVDRRTPDRFPLLEGNCNGEHITVTFDRRVAERRSSHAARSPDRRVQDRRALPVVADWPACGWIAFQEKPIQRGPLSC